VAGRPGSRVADRAVPVPGRLAHPRTARPVTALPPGNPALMTPDRVTAARQPRGGSTVGQPPLSHLARVWHKQQSCRPPGRAHATARRRSRSAS
jgi:hypothetical protein